MWGRTLEVLVGIVASRNPNVVPRLLGHFWLASELARGRRGTTYLARDLILGRKVALTRIEPRRATDASLVAQLTREAYAATLLEHPNLARAYDFGDDRGVPYFTCEFVDGHPLDERTKTKGPLRVAEAVSYVLQAARGLWCAHQQCIVHGQISPRNLVVSSDGLVKLTDLGPANAPDRAEFDPELAEFQAKVDDDLAALGKTLHQLLTGSPHAGSVITPANESIPAGESNLAASLLVKEIPRRLSTIVERMVATSPENRFKNVGEVITALEGFLGMTSSLPFTPRDEDATLLEECARSFHRSSAALLRSRIKLLAVGGCYALAFLFVVSARPIASMGFASLGLLISFADFVLAGVRRKSALFVKVREGVATARRSEWLTGLAAIAIVTVLLLVLKLFWLWLGLAFLAVGIVAALHAAFDRRIDAERAQPLARVERLLRKLRLDGNDENAVRQFVWTQGGVHAEHLYEVLFGYEAKRQARRPFPRGEQWTSRVRYAPWRDPLADWLDAGTAARRQASDIVKLQKIEERRLEALGQNLVTARRKARRSAEAMAATAAEIRQSIRAGDDEYLAQHPIAVSIRQAALEPEKVLLHREVGLLPEQRRSGEFKNLAAMIVGPKARLIAGILLLAGCIAWMHQNAMISPEHAGGLVEATKAGDVDAIRTHAQAEVAHARAAAARPTDMLDLPLVPRPLLQLVSSFGSGASGIFLIISSVFRSGKIAFFAVAAAAMPLLGDRFNLPTPPGLEPGAIPIIAGLAIMVAGFVFGRK